MLWLVFGANGWIGNQVLRVLRETRPDDEVVSSGNVRADDENRLPGLLARLCPDRVLCLVGRTHGPGYDTIDYLETPGRLVENVRDNLFAPVLLSLLCEREAIHLTYLGTGCIFTYNDTTPDGFDFKFKFKETDKPNFFGSSYSIVKGYTDRMMKMFESSVLNARIRMPITADFTKRNFVTKITTYEKVCSIANSMTVLPELLPIMIDMAVRKVTGTVNLTNPGAITHNEILTMYKEIVDPSFEWTNFTIDEQNTTLLSARSNNMLDTTRLVSMYPRVRPIHEAVRAVLEQMSLAQA